MNEGTYTVSIRVRHATLRADEIASIIGHSPTRAVDVGEMWTTPKGGVVTQNGLPKIARETYCTFSKVNGPLEEFQARLASLADELSLNSSLPELARSGEVELFIGLFMDGHAGFKLRPDLLRRLSDLGVSLGICLYPPEQSESAD